MKTSIKRQLRNRKRVQRRKQEDGFLIVEAVVAIFLLVVGLLAASSVLATVSMQQRVSTLITVMTNLSEEKIETLRQQSYTDLASSSENFGEIPSFIDYKREVTVVPNGDDTMKTVQVTVTYLSGLEISIDTFIAR
jgi:Tfp pilus assembly protein PilV